MQVYFSFLSLSVISITHALWHHLVCFANSISRKSTLIQWRNKLCFHSFVDKLAHRKETS